MKTVLRILRAVAVLYVALLVVVFVKQRSLLFFPSHDDSARLGAEAGLVRWIENGRYIGMKREPQADGRIWLFLHGNGGTT